MEARSHLSNRNENRIWVNLSNPKNSVFISAVIMSISDRITLKKRINFIILLESIREVVKNKKIWNHTFKKHPPHSPSMSKSEFIVTDLCALINQ